MGNPKVGRASNGEIMHYSVGAVIKRKTDVKYFLIDRNTPPWGFACPAGHIDKGESPEQALNREVGEEIGLKVIACELVLEEERLGNWCNKGIDHHYWYVFNCEVEGEVKRSERETKSADWYSEEDINQFYEQKKLEPVWEYWFKKLRVIK